MGERNVHAKNMRYITMTEDGASDNLTKMAENEMQMMITTNKICMVLFFIATPVCFSSNTRHVVQFRFRFVLDFAAAVNVSFKADQRLVMLIINDLVLKDYEAYFEKNGNCGTVIWNRQAGC